MLIERNYATYEDKQIKAKKINIEDFCEIHNLHLSFNMRSDRTIYVQLKDRSGRTHKEINGAIWTSSFGNGRTEHSALVSLVRLLSGKTISFGGVEEIMVPVLNTKISKNLLKR